MKKNQQIKVTFAPYTPLGSMGLDNERYPPGEQMDGTCCRSRISTHALYLVRKMKYNSPTFIKPPRAEQAIPSILFPLYEKRGYWGQIKKNGTNNIIAVSPDKQLTTWERHGNPHKLWSFTEASAAAFKSLPGGWHVINTELMHSKTPGIKDTNYIHDILVHDGEFLVGTTYAQRYAILQKLFLNNAQGSTPSHWIINAHTWLARNFRESFQAIFAGIAEPKVDEGIILKDPNMTLSVNTNNSWLVKARVPHKNYSF